MKLTIGFLVGLIVVALVVLGVVKKAKRLLTYAIVLGVVGAIIYLFIL